MTCGFSADTIRFRLGVMRHDPAIAAMPNFPLVVTEERIRREAVPARFACHWRIDFPPHWTAYLFRAPDMDYWRVDVVSRQ